MKISSLVLALLFSIVAEAQQSRIILPKIEDYIKGELEIKVAPFGVDNPVSVGAIATDGTIHFNWDNDISSIKDSEFYMSSIKNALGMIFCNNKEVEQHNKEVKTVDASGLFLYKNGQQVGMLFPATQKEIKDNVGSNRHTSLVLGSAISWYYCNGDGNFKAVCTVNLKYENSYDFKEVTTYDVQLKKGWNMVLHTLVDKEDWTYETKKGSLPKTITKTSIETVPNNINWYVNYFGN